MFEEINGAHGGRLDPSEVGERTSYLLAEINGILGVTGGGEDALLTYADNINTRPETARLNGSDYDRYAETDRTNCLEFRGSRYFQTV